MKKKVAVLLAMAMAAGNGLWRMILKAAAMLILY